MGQKFARNDKVQEWNLFIIFLSKLSRQFYVSLKTQEEVFHTFEERKLFKDRTKRTKHISGINLLMKRSLWSRFAHPQIDDR
jgi:hypothetical protein